MCLPASAQRNQRLLPALAKAAGVKTTFHDLRHDHATRLFAAGWHAKDVQDRLGHSTITVTIDTYTHQVPARKNAIANWLQSTLPATAKL
ncbi:hypothetical protein SCACP_08100 [Sporomusa carbonis]|uniref:tyrosine-type recombinase/integrase n=1 Tax=Sporomusa carbonis TaxID=3076075 RepID=UPI003A73082E